MKINKIYKLIFGEIIKPKEYQKQMKVDDEHILITPNGYYGFVFNKKSLPFNLEMIKEATITLDLFSVIKPENLCKLTKCLVVDSKLGFLNILKNGGRKIYVNSKYLGYFESYTEFYQEKDLSLIVAVECGQIVGCIMPIRYLEGETDE